MQGVSKKSFLVSYCFDPALQVKANKRDSTVQVEFKRDTGAMTPVLFCKPHNLDGRRVYDFCDTNDKGEVCFHLL